MKFQILKKKAKNQEEIFIFNFQFLIYAIWKKEFYFYKNAESLLFKILKYDIGQTYLTKVQVER